MAERLLAPAPPCLVAVGGLSGSGKSVLAAGLAPDVGAVPGAIVIRSDEIRKQLSGAPVLERLGPEGYTPHMSSRVYSTMADQAARVIRSGHAAIVDAVYARPADRHAIERVAIDASVPFVGVWLDAPESMLLARVEQRRGDASDAGPDVVRMQLQEELGDIRWRRLDASVPPDDVRRRAAAMVHERVLSYATIGGCR
jgi:predicted kinase